MGAAFVESFSGWRKEHSRTAALPVTSKSSPSKCQELTPLPRPNGPAAGCHVQVKVARPPSPVPFSVGVVPVEGCGLLESASESASEATGGFYGRTGFDGRTGDSCFSPSSFLQEPSVFGLGNESVVVPIDALAVNY